MRQNHTNRRQSFSNLRSHAFVNPKRQAGWTMWSMLFVMAVVFIAAYIVIQLVPIYAANENIKNALFVSLENKNMASITRSQVIRGMQNQLYLDGASDLIDFKNNFKMTKSNGRVVASANYQREVPLVANLVLIAKFSPVAECEKNGRCEVK